MKELEEQWVDVIDGQEHMVKAIKPTDLCQGCLFNGNGGGCWWGGFDDECEMGSRFIIKDLGILNDDGLLPCPFCGEPSSGIASIRGIAFVKILANFICKKCEAQITFCADTVEHCLDAWNRRA